MKKKVLLILSTILALNAGAERITRDEALALAQDFMQGKVMVPVQASSSKAPLRGGVNDESFYIFNAVDNGGYAIIAADDRISPVLGFSDQGNINLDNMPENMASWLENYKYEISNLKSGDVEAFIDAPVSRSEVKPLLNCLWDQIAPYNLLCPVYDGIRCPAGCVAVAMAEIMYYYKWPVGVVDSIPPYINMYNSRLVEGLPATTFKWDIINPSYRSDETEENAYAMAELLRYCGQAVDMGYETYGSGTYDRGVPKALIERFKYSRQTKIVSKCDFSSYDWDEMIYNELASGRPVYYGGCRTLDYGHAFVCDGYKDGYFHINWGQGGYNNGYFKLSLLSGESTYIYDQYNYGYSQRVIIGIEPDMNNLTGTTFTDDNFSYTVLSDTSVMIKAIEDKNYYGTDTLWIPDYVDYEGNRYYITRLGTSANNNYDYKKVYLPSSLKHIDTQASFLQTVTEFTIPSSIEVLSSTAFEYNKSLERFIAGEDSRYKVINGVLFSHDGKELMCYPQGRKDTCYIIPDGVKTIGGYSFSYNKNLLEIILPDCVEHINHCAFLDCHYLKRIKMPYNLKDIGWQAFSKCYDLSDIILPPKISPIFEYSFSVCKSLKSIIIPGGLSYCLAVGTFQNCSSLEYVYIPSGIKMI
ncbi:MAG: C10 family peptidase, partial [Bacteroidaceae bacterium]|nr:C10 family peptidase [Bacteroidaceae bacterium]